MWMTPALMKYFYADDWQNKKQVLEVHPELLSPLVQDLTDELTQYLIQEEGVNGVILKLRILELQICRERGIEETERHFTKDTIVHPFELSEELIDYVPYVGKWMFTEEIEVRKKLLRANPELLSPEIDKIFDEIIAKALNNGSFLQAANLVVNRDFLQKARDVGGEETFHLADERRIPYQTEHLFETIHNMIISRWEEKRSWIERNPFLLTSTAINVFGLFIQSNEIDKNHHNTEALKQIEYLLVLCMQLGVDRVFKSTRAEQ